MRVFPSFLCDLDGLISVSFSSLSLAMAAGDAVVFVSSLQRAQFVTRRSRWDEGQGRQNLIDASAWADFGYFRRQNKGSNVTDRSCM